MTIGDEKEPAGEQESRAKEDSVGAGTGDARNPLETEASRLADAFSAWAGSSGTADRADTPAAAGCGCGSGAGLDVVCRACPICRVASYVQTVRPEVLERVADVLAMIAGSLQAIAADRESATSADDSAGGRGVGDPPLHADHVQTEESGRSGTSIPVDGEDDPR